MATRKKGFKVVTVREDGTLVSAIDTAAVCAYGTGAITTRPIGWGPLAVFKSLSHARNWTKGCLKQLQIYRCLYAPSSDDSLWDCDTLPLREYEVPEGTLFADDVILTEKIE